jgi:hypothetical protein
LVKVPEGGQIWQTGRLSTGGGHVDKSAEAPRIFRHSINRALIVRNADAALSTDDAPGRLVIHDFIHWDIHRQMG